MKTDDIKKMGLAYVQVLEKSTMDPVNPSELKGTHAQRKDKDIDNDGKVDKSDEYLHKRRQAISKAMKKEATDTQMGTITVTSDEERKKRAQMYRDKKAASVKKEEVEQSKWPIYSRILEKRDMHVKGATPPEPIDSKASKGEKDFVNMHGGLNGNDSGIDGAKAAADTAKAATANVKVSPKRPNDQMIGDKTMPKPKG